MIRALALALLLAGPALAQMPMDAQLATDPGDTTLTVTADRDGITARQRAVPAQLSASQRAAWRALFLDIEAGRLRQAEAALEGLGNSLLRETARAQIIVARGPGKMNRAELVQWLSAHTDLPEAPRIAKIAAGMRGQSAALPALPTARRLQYVSFNPPLAFRSETGRDDAAAAASLKPLLAADRNAEAEAG